MTEAFIYDAIRTPRGRGKNTGSLHATKPISLVQGLLEAVLERNPNLDAQQSKTSSWVASRRLASRAATSRERRHWLPASKPLVRAFSSTGSADPGWRR